jgi:formylglycine-generating enzyme required for sulfatase activity
MPLLRDQILQQRYQIGSVLGQGGMGIVYEAFDLNLKVNVALKEMFILDAAHKIQWQQQFRQEAEILARLNHVNLVNVIDFFELGTNAYLVMRFVAGESLEQRIKREGVLPEKQVLAWADQLLDALAYCHAHHIIHRDIKPANIIIQPDNRIVLVDFGLVKQWNPAAPHTQTAMRGIGTPEYTPPEQYGGNLGHTDPRSDLYSVGATLYHALAGQAPPSATQRMADPEQFIPLRQLNPAVSQQTEAAIGRAMEMARNQRFPDAATMRTALSPSSSPQRPFNWLWLPAVMLLALLAGGGLWAITNADQTSPPTTITAGMPLTPTPDPLSISALTSEPTPTATFNPSPTPTTLAATPTPTQPPADTPTPEEEPAAPLILAPQPGATTVSSQDGMTLVYVPAGPFIMGSKRDDPNADEDEKPQHTVDLDAFWIDQTEVTNGMFARFVAETDYLTDAEQQGGGEIWTADNEASFTEGANWRNPHGPTSNINGRDNHPVTQVSWRDAVAYCLWAGRRLPTEAEWEKAARGDEGQPYPWGYQEAAGHLANFADISLNVDWAAEDTNDNYRWTAPAGNYPAGASPYNALDMGGNLYEWVFDWYDGDYYGRSPGDNPTGPEGGIDRVLRGGSWASSGIYTRAAFRYHELPGTVSHLFGFRCAVSVLP